MICEIIGINLIVVGMGGKVHYKCTDTEMIGVPIAAFSKLSIRAYRCWTARYRIDNVGPGRGAETAVCNAAPGRLQQAPPPYSSTVCSTYCTRVTLHTLYYAAPA